VVLLCLLLGHLQVLVCLAWLELLLLLVLLLEYLV
jgi:hypothetical protein